MSDVDSKEVKRIKEEIKRLKGKNTKLSTDLQSLWHDYVDLRKDCEEKTKTNEELMRKQRAKRDYTFKLKQDLVAANTELTWEPMSRI